MLHALLLVVALFSTASADPAASILGKWRGTSICVKIPENSYCHDEVVVYDFTRNGTSTDSVTLHAYKIVDGKPELMGELACTYDPQSGRWNAPFKGRRSEILWSYVVRGDDMTGTCILIPSKTRVRDVSVKRGQ